MPNFPDPDRDGSFSYRLNNGSGQFSRGLWLPAGASPTLKLQSAGNGIQLVAADGVTVILNVPETGFVTPTQTNVQLVPQASAPAGITEGAIWYSSVDHAWHGLDDTGDVVFVTQ